MLVSSGDPYDPDACAVPGLIDLVTGELRLFPGPVSYTHLTLPTSDLV